VAVFIAARLMPEKSSAGQKSAVYLAPVQPVGEEFKIVLQEVISVLDKGE
jgi:hypothetical protein